MEEFPRAGDQMHQSNFRPCGDFAGPPDWRVHCKGVIAPKRNLFVAAPCCGCLEASTQVFQGLACNYMLNNVYDLEDGYEDVIKSLAGDRITKLNLGARSGNLLNTKLEELEGPTDFLLAGPPCPPWAGNGRKKTISDARADVFGRILEWVVFLSEFKDLKAFVLENVSGTLKEWHGEVAYMTWAADFLSTSLTNFHVQVQKLNTCDYSLPQDRVRVFLCGFRRDISERFPAALPPFEATPKLESFLNGKLPNVVVGSLSPRMRQNVRGFEGRLKSMLILGEIKKLARPRCIPRGQGLRQ